MKKKILLALALLTALAYGADVKISQLPLGSAATTGSADSFPYVSTATNVTKRLTVWDLSHVPTIVSTYAPIASPTFTGVATSPSFVGPLTGNVTGNVTGNASTATALAANPVDCSSNQFANAIAANGDLTCSAVAASQLSGTVGISQGGTGQTTKAPAFDALSPMTTLGDVIYGGASGTGTRLARGTTGQLFSSNTGAAPSWTSAAYPQSTTINQILYSSSANIVGGLSTANTGVLVTDSSGVPSIQACSTANRVLRTDGSALTCSQVAAGTDISGQLAIANGGTGASSKAAAFNALSPMTTGGDLIYGGASGVGTRLPNGSAGQVLTSQGTTLAPIWTAPGSLTPVSYSSGPQTLAAAGYEVKTDLTGGAFQVNLPAASSNSGGVIWLKKTDASANALTIARAGSDTIDGGTTYTLTVQFEGVILVSDGVSVWSVF